MANSDAHNDPAHLIATTEESGMLERLDGGKTWKAFGE
jgi:hypothetical protein